MIYTAAVLIRQLREFWYCKGKWNQRDVSNYVIGLMIAIGSSAYRSTDISWSTTLNLESQWSPLVQDWRYERVMKKVMVQFLVYVQNLSIWMKADVSNS